MRKAVIVGVIVVAAAAAIYLATMFFGGRSIRRILKRYAYTELVPPNILVPPGTIVEVMKKEPLVVSVVCSATDSLGAALQQRLLSSPSVSSEAQEKLTGDFQLEADVKNRVVPRAASDFVKDISVSLSNVTLLELPLSDVEANVRNRSPQCSDAIRDSLQDHRTLSMIRSVIRATAVYRISFRASASGTARTAATKSVAGSLALAQGVVSDDRIQGENLFWGARDDHLFATITANRPPPTGGGPTVPERELPPGALAEVIVHGH